MRREMSSIRRCQCPETKEVSCWRLRTDRKSPPTWTYHRANTTRPWEVGRPSTFLPGAPFRKARVDGLACIRRCPRFFFSPGETEKRSGQRDGSDSEAVVVASVGKFVHESSIRFPKRSAGGSGRYIRSRGCKLRGGPKISRRMIAPRKPDVDASNVAMSVLRFAPLGTVREAAA